MKKLLILMLTALLLISNIVFVTSCNTPEPPVETPDETPLETPAESKEDSKPESSSQTDTPQPEPESKTEYDKDELYRHVFEDQSVKISYEDLSTIELDHKSGEGVLLIHLGKSDELEKADYYLVKGVTSKTSDNCSKYYMVPSLLSSFMVGGKVTDDYHEAYLDVMFENLTFSECEKIPDYNDGIYDLAGISAGGKQYEVCADGYIYYAEGEGKFKSDQKTDAPYLYIMALMADINKDRLNGDIKSYFNELYEVEEPYEIKQVQNGDEIYTYYVKEDGTAYRIDEPGWIFMPHEFGATIGTVGIHAQRTMAIFNAEKNGIFNEH